MSKPVVNKYPLRLGLSFQRFLTAIFPHERKNYKQVVTFQEFWVVSIQYYPSFFSFKYTL